MVEKTGTTINFVEESAVIIGTKGTKFCLGDLRQRQFGERSSVEFPWQWVLEREDNHGDIIGFYHTHPGSGLQSAHYSARDNETMSQWVECLGKPLICAIESGPALRVWLFRKKSVRELSGRERIGNVLVIRVKLI